MEYVPHHMSAEAQLACPWTQPHWIQSPTCELPLPYHGHQSTHRTPKGWSRRVRFRISVLVLESVTTCLRIMDWVGVGESITWQGSSEVASSFPRGLGHFRTRTRDLTAAKEAKPEPTPHSPPPAPGQRGWGRGAATRSRGDESTAATAPGREGGPLPSAQLKWNWNYN